MLFPRTKVHLRVSTEDPGLCGTVELADKSSGSVLIRKDNYEQARFRFDSVLPADSPQNELFRVVGRPAVKRFVAGGSVAILTYGQSGTGKTYTLFGPSLTRSSPGLVQQALEYTASHLARDRDAARLSLSALCVYQDQVTDLIPSKRASKREQSVTLTSTSSIELQGVSHAVSLLSEVVSVQSHAKVFGKPSRGHSVVIFTISRRRGGEDDKLHRSHLFLIDLAGEELRVKSSASEVYRSEATHINQSLRVLAQCLQSERGRRPYKESVLTTVMSPMFNHVHEIHLLAFISGKPEDIDQTLSTLSFAQSSMNLCASQSAGREELKLTAAEREREVGEREDRLRREKEERETLAGKNEELRVQLEKVMEKNGKLESALRNLTETLRKATEEREGLLRAQEEQFQRRLQSQLSSLAQEKEVEMTEFRIKVSTEVSQSFATKVQTMTTEHEMTVSRLMEALLEKQRQEQQLIDLVQKEQEEVRRLKMQMAMCTEESKQGESERPPLRPDAILESEISMPSLSLPLEIPREAQSSPREAENLAETSPLCEVSDQAAVQSGAVSVVSREDQSPSEARDPSSVLEEDQRAVQSGSEGDFDPRRRLLFTLKNALSRMQTHVAVEKLSRKHKPKRREVWLEGASALLASDSSTFRSCLQSARVAWSTTSRFKRPINVSFLLSDIDEVEIGRDSPGLQRVPALEEKENQCLWVKYRRGCYFEVAFDEESDAEVWEAGLKTAKLAIAHEEPPFSLWKQYYELFDEVANLRT